VKNLICVLILSFFACSCATMTSETRLLEGVSRKSNIDEVEIIVTVDIAETQQYCNQYAPMHQVVLNCLTNACFIPACAIPFVNAEGVIKKCYVYLWAKVDSLLAHETEHCIGKADLLY
jgi:hypothetical protein